jgi:predicted DCC family thiol-disulfide oxidoreductase YuxK
MKVYYNGSCNICNAEINQYKKSSQNINYIDISKYSDTDISHLDKKKLFRRMHVYDQGKLYSGTESFIILWSKMPKLKYIANCLKLPLLKQAWYIIYELTATALYWKNKSKL